MIDEPFWTLAMVVIGGLVLLFTGYVGLIDKRVKKRCVPTLLGLGLAVVLVVVYRYNLLSWTVQVILFFTISVLISIGLIRGTIEEAERRRRSSTP